MSSMKQYGVARYPRRLRTFDAGLSQAKAARRCGAGPSTITDNATQAQVPNDAIADGWDTVMASDAPPGSPMGFPLARTSHYEVRLRPCCKTEARGDDGGP